MNLLVPSTDGHHPRKTGSHIFRRDKDAGAPGTPASVAGLFAKDPWWKDVLPGYRELDPSELIPGHDSGVEVTSVCINTAVYLPWLLGQCVRAGVVVRRAVLSHVSEAAGMSHTGQRHADIIVNATGLGARKLGGVEDGAMKPARGQIVLVRNESSPMISSSGTDDGRAEILYLMQRAAGGGTVLGGTYDVGNWESAPDPNVATRIMQRAVTARPELVGGPGSGRGVEGLSVVRHAVGLRPYREGGVRVEGERLADGTWVVHNYGHAGWGYQGSYGCAEGVVEIIDGILKDGQPKL